MTYSTETTLRSADGRKANTCPVCGVHHLHFWDDYHEITDDVQICEDCAFWADGNIPDELRGISFKTATERTA